MSRQSPKSQVLNDSESVASSCSGNSRRIHCTSGAEIPGIHVSVRIRPLSSEEFEKGCRVCCQGTGKSSLMISKPETAGSYLKSQAAADFEFAFDAVYDDGSTQSDVYTKSAQPYLKKVMKGENVTIFAYGATGAGKTHTMFGNTRFDSTAAFAGAGLIPQAVADLFQQIHSLENTSSAHESWSVAMSFMEVYNEHVHDLLEPMNKNLPLREDPDRGLVNVVGLSEFPVNKYDEVLELLMRGQVNRKTEATKANIVSSRSHAIIQLSITHKRRTTSGQITATETKLSLIDLAGSERASATQNSGLRLQESANINKSLLALANCINALSERQLNANTSSAASSPRKKSKKLTTNVKYRDSKLTHLLKGSLEGNCNLVMIANVNPSHLTFDDTYRTLQYANRAKNIKVSSNKQQQEQVEESTFVERESRLREDNAVLRQRVSDLEAAGTRQADSEVKLLQSLSQALEDANKSKLQAAALQERLLLAEQLHWQSQQELEFMKSELIQLEKDGKENIRKQGRKRSIDSVENELVEIPPMSRDSTCAQSNASQTRSSNRQSSTKGSEYAEMKSDAADNNQVNEDSDDDDGRDYPHQDPGSPIRPLSPSYSDPAHASRRKRKRGLLSKYLCCGGSQR